MENEPHAGTPALLDSEANDATASGIMRVEMRASDLAECSKSSPFLDVLLSQTVLAQTLGRGDDRQFQTKVATAAAAALCGIQPVGELEGLLAAQLVVTHAATMECYRRATVVGRDNYKFRDYNLNQANKCSRTFVILLEALNKHRGKGQQKVTVEHVHVHQGGQAIVGHVERKGEGGGETNRGSTPCS